MSVVKVIYKSKDISLQFSVLLTCRTYFLRYVTVTLNFKLFEIFGTSTYFSLEWW